jgi:MtN3 and saliva related transmembrane protein
METKKKITFRLLYGYYMIFIGVFGQLVFFAQAHKIFITKSASDVSMLGFVAGLISVTSWLIYGIMLKDRPLIIANAVACSGAIAVLIGVVIYG